MDTIAQQYQEAIDRDDIPGAIAVARDATGQFKYTKAFGSRTLLDGTKKSLQIDDILALYSCTKLITTVATLQCVEKGLFTLDEDIGRVLPFFKDVKVLAGFEVGQPLFHEKKSPVTLRRLLTHTSGTPYETLDPALQKWRAHEGPLTAEQQSTVEGRGKFPLAFQPGDSFAYGTGLDWAGKAVEKVSSLSLEDYFKKHIFEPLGIVSASFFPMKDSDMRSHMVDLNPEDPDGNGLAPIGGIPTHVGVKDCFGGDGIYMPATEYIKLLYSLLINDEKLLRAQTVSLMFEPHLEPGPHALVNGAFAEEMAKSPVGGGLPVDAKRDYGLSGLLVQEDLPGRYKDTTLMWGGAFNTWWFIDRRTGLCGIGSPQMYLRDAPFLRGENYVFKPHREGAMRWEQAAAHFKDVFTMGIYQAYESWKAKANIQ